MTPGKITCALIGASPLAKKRSVRRSSSTAPKTAWISTASSKSSSENGTSTVAVPYPIRAFGEQASSPSSSRRASSQVAKPSVELRIFMPRGSARSSSVNGAGIVPAVDLMLKPKITVVGTPSLSGEKRAFRCPDSTARLDRASVRINVRATAWHTSARPFEPSGCNSHLQFTDHLHDEFVVAALDRSIDPRVAARLRILAGTVSCRQRPCEARVHGAGPSDLSDRRTCNRAPSGVDSEGPSHFGSPDDELHHRWRIEGSGPCSPLNRCFSWAFNQVEFGGLTNRDRSRRMQLIAPSGQRATEPDPRQQSADEHEQDRCADLRREG